MNIYLVGGAVRDMLCGKIPRDYDWAFAGTPEEFVQGNPSARKIIRNKNVFWLNDGEYAQIHGSIKEDLLRRDFTINALALEESGRLYAHPQALPDIIDRVLRPASPSALTDDPIRVFRAARLSACLDDYRVHPDCLQQMRDAAPLLGEIAAEQVGRELWKALESTAPSRFFRLLAEAACLSPWFAELEQAQDVIAGPAPWHDGPVFDHLMHVLDGAAIQGAPDPLTNWMALCHDLGKIDTDPAILPHHYDHESRGVKTAELLAKRLRLSGRALEAGSLAARLHMKAARYPKLRAGTRVDLLMDLHTHRLFTELFTVALADGKSTRQEGFGRENFLLTLAKPDLERILAVELPEKWRDKGEASGKRLRELRCRVLVDK